MWGRVSDPPAGVAASKTPDSFSIEPAQAGFVIVAATLVAAALTWARALGGGAPDTVAAAKAATKIKSAYAD